MPHLMRTAILAALTTAATYGVQAYRKRSSEKRRTQQQLAEQQWESDGGQPVARPEPQKRPAAV